MLGIKKSLIGLLTLLFITPFSVQAAKYVDYKCYLDTTAGKKVIYFTWKQSKVRTRLANMVTKKITVDGDTRVMVKQKLECIKADKTFSNKEAYKIDSQLVH